MGTTGTLLHAWPLTAVETAIAIVTSLRRNRSTHLTVAGTTGPTAHHGNTVGIFLVQFEQLLLLHIIKSILLGHEVSTLLHHFLAIHSWMSLT